MLPAERAGRPENVVKQERDMVASFVNLSNRDLDKRIKSEPKARSLFEELGSDQVILTYAFNFRDRRTGNWNESSDNLNKLNQRIYEICSISDPKTGPKDLRLIITGSQFDVDTYGREFVDHYARRLGVTNANSITFLISTTMNPWTTDVGPPIYDFLDVVEVALRDAVYQAIGELGFASPANHTESEARRRG
jgi:hypothetical protein